MSKNTKKSNRNPVTSAEAKEAQVPKKEFYSYRKFKNSKAGNTSGNFKRKPDKDKFTAISSKSAVNDPDWYFTDSKLAEQTCSFSFPYFLGIKPTIGSTDIPTVLMGYVNPCPGVTLTAVGAAYQNSTGFEMACQKLYTRLSVASGRTAEYQPNDVGLILLAATEVGSMIEYARRFFGVATTYNVRNRTFAQRIMAMLAGVIGSQTDSFNSDFGSDFVTNFNKYRADINALITKFNQVPLFGDIGYVRKSMEIYQKIFLDDVAETAQVIALSPNSTWEIDETGEQGTILRTVQIRRQITTFADIITIIRNMIDKLLNSTSYNKVYADILNYQAKFSANFIKLDYIYEGYAVIPEYSDRFLQQIHNASAMGPWTEWGEGQQPDQVTELNNVYSSVTTGGIKYNPSFRYFNYHQAGNGQDEQLAFDFTTSSPTLEDRIDNIMFRCAGPIARHGGTSTGNAPGSGTILPDHYISYFHLYGTLIENGIAFQNNGYYGNPILEGANSDFGINLTTSSGTLSGLCSVLTAVHLAPILYAYVNASGYDYAKPTALWGEKTFLTTLSRDKFQQILQLSYQGLFELR